LKLSIRDRGSRVFKERGKLFPVDSDFLTHVKINEKIIKIHDLKVTNNEADGK
jgi:hypothetical protein